MKKLSWFSFFIIFTVSCLDEPDCYQLHNNLIGVTFRVIGTGQADSVWLKDDKDRWVTVTSFSDSLNYFAREGTFIFERVGDIINTLTFAYDVKNQFVAEDCGSAFVLSDLRILDHDFDSVRIVNSTPTKAGGPNIDIYRCPETDTLTIEFNQLLASTNGTSITNPRSIYLSHDFESVTDLEKVLFTGRNATVKLPVDLTKNAAVFVFETNDSKDTLEITYNRVVEERYAPCGVQTFVTDLTIGEHTFDSVSYGLDELDEPRRTLLDPHLVNLSVFDCPQTNLMKVDFVREPNILQVTTIKSITGNHFEGDLLQGLQRPVSTNTITLPVDLESNFSTFFIQYEDDSIDTLSVQYTRAPLTLFNACPNPVITELLNANDAANITVVDNGTTLQFPAVKNVEITVD